MTNSEPNDATTAPKKPRQRRAAAKPTVPDTLPVGNAASMSKNDVTAMAPPGIEEDGAWIQADAVEVHQGAIGAARGDRVSVEMGVLGAAMGGEVSVSQGAAGTILAQHARVEQAFVRTMIAQDVAIHRPSVVGFLLAQRVSGDVKVLLDWRGALAFGAVFGILAGAFGRGRRKA